jgi:hypothetical protein
MTLQKLPRLAAFTSSIVATLSLTAAVAVAQPSDSRANADLLFTQARDLAAKGNYVEACPKFEASLRLDPALGTRLNLADCYEASGKVASAWAMFRAAADVAKINHDPREQLASRRATALEAKLPKLVIRIDGTPTPGLTIVRSGAAIEPAMLGSATYVDPGRTVITASAPGFVDFTATVEAKVGESVEVVVPPLKTVAATTTTPTPTPTAKSNPPLVTKAPAHPTSGMPKRRVVAFAVGGAGIALTGVGIGLGISANNLWSGAFNDGLCKQQTNECTTAGQAQTDKARSRAMLSTVAVGTGVVALGVATYLYFTSRSHHSTESAWVPMVAPDQAGMAWVSSF